MNSVKRNAILAGSLFLSVIACCVAGSLLVRYILAPALEVNVKNDSSQTIEVTCLSPNYYPNNRIIAPGGIDIGCTDVNIGRIRIAVWPKGHREREIVLRLPEDINLPDGTQSYLLRVDDKSFGVSHKELLGR